MVHSIAAIGTNNMSTFLSGKFSTIPDLNRQRVSRHISLSALFAAWNQILASLTLIALLSVDVVVALTAELAICVPTIFLSANRAFAIVEFGNVIVTEVAAVPF